MYLGEEMNPKMGGYIPKTTKNPIKAIWTINPFRVLLVPKVHPTPSFLDLRRKLQPICNETHPGKALVP